MVQLSVVASARTASHGCTTRSSAHICRWPATGETLGGLTGRTSLGLWFVDLLYLPEKHGWTEFGRIPISDGRSRIFFRKELRA